MSNKQLYEKENNINKPFFPVVRLEDIIDTISEKSIQWILNNYNHIYVEWKNDVVGTRLSVPTILRRNGLWITYNNGDRLITEYYIGKNTEIKDKHWQDNVNWEDYTNKLIDGTVEYRHLSENLKQLFNKGNITNFPDEEDLTSNGVTLSFKDREYQQENFSGLGRVILRKNIVKIGEKYKNILTQNMINKENTIYEIRYDFNLNGQEITIPEGCVLDLQGGSLSNGTINGENTMLKSDIHNIFRTITIKGTWNVPDIYSSWFDFDNTTGFDNIKNFTNINSLINDNINNNIYINGSYWTSVYDGGKGVLELKSNTHLYINGSINIIANNYEYYRLILISGANNVHIYGGQLIGDVETHIGETGEWGYGVQFLSSVNCSIHNTEISFMWGDGIDINGYDELIENICENIIIDNCYIHNCRRQGISIEHCQNSIVQNCRIESIGEPKFTLPGAAIDIEPFNGRICKNIKVYNCEVINCGGPYIYSGDNDIVDKIYFKNVVFGTTTVFRMYNGVCICENCVFSNSMSLKGTIKGYIQFRDCDIAITDFGSVNVSFYRCSISPNNVTEFWHNTYKTLLRCNSVEKNDSNIYKIDINNCEFGFHNPNHDAHIAFITYQEGAYNNYEVDIRNCDINLNKKKDITIDLFVDLHRCNVYSKFLRLRPINGKTMCLYDCNVTTTGMDKGSIILFRGNDAIPDSYRYDIRNLYVNSAIDNVFSIYPGEDVSDLFIKVEGYRRNYDFYVQDGDFNVFEKFKSHRIRLIEDRRIRKTSTENPQLPFYDKGINYFNTLTNKYRMWQGEYWLGLDGMTDALKKGATELRPTSLNNTTDIGYMYYDTSLNKPIFYKGNGKWVDATGAEI